MVFPVHLQRSAVVAIVDCPDLGQFIGSLSLRQAALQLVCLFQEALISSLKPLRLASSCRLPSEPPLAPKATAMCMCLWVSMPTTTSKLVLVCERGSGAAVIATDVGRGCN